MLKSLSLYEEPDKPPVRAVIGWSVSTSECEAHAVSASALAPNNVVDHSSASDESGSSRRAFRCTASSACAPRSTLLHGKRQFDGAWIT
ncbi:hypothetical protein [Burkholderia diffusa]|uniref:hypothetical protein n=1 Tax=Burkholderia diffusa TaxID=488732 RepID=UPI000770C977|nr:hypothetical protein [Burkholderia diffusa]KVC47353.1 hypothetical protein WI71_11010 [Burkholderia diffusa]